MFLTHQVWSSQKPGGGYCPEPGFVLSSGGMPRTTATRCQNPGNEPYHGFEQGPIRPPSEADSLLIRVTRNCPWNRCTFCPVYKEHTFSRRPVDHVHEDIRRVAVYVAVLRAAGGIATYADAAAAAGLDDWPAFCAAANWLDAGMASVFLQDADSLVLRPAEFSGIVREIRTCFPGVERITSYARSRTVDRWSAEDLGALAGAGLNRLHIGLESGADRVLAQVQKGVTQAIHIRAGRKVVAAGMELSEYVMPGLGGRALSAEHARETAAAIRAIAPHSVRLRTLALPPGAPLVRAFRCGEFVPCRDVETMAEIRRFIAGLDGVVTRIVSDHILNLLPEIEGDLPGDRPRLLAVLDRFLALPPEEQVLFQLGRRAMIFHTLADLERPGSRDRAARLCRRLGATPHNVDEIIAALMAGFV